MKITGILVVHNEDQFVERALASMCDVVDELLVAHDGPCRDRSLELAGKFTDNVFVNEFRGAPEINAITLLRRASHDWILRVDCDETLSPKLRAKILRLREQGPPADVTHYHAVWRAVYDPGDPEAEEPRAGEQPTRLLLFRRSAAKWVGIPHRSPQVTGRSLGISECVLHWAPHQQYSAWELITRKMFPFSKNDAKIRVVYPIEQYGLDGVDPKDFIPRRDRMRHEHPLLMGPLLAGLSFTRALWAARRSKNLSELGKNLRWSFPHAAYQLFLAYHIYLYKRQAAQR